MSIRPHRESLISYGLAFVSAWFSWQEISAPKNWADLVPHLFPAAWASTLVMAHGIILGLVALALLFNYHRRLASAVLSLLLLEIIVNFIETAGLSGVAVRDIGLFASALALAVGSKF